MNLIIGGVENTLTFTPGGSVPTGTYTLNYKISYTGLPIPADLANLSFQITVVECSSI